MGVGVKRKKKEEGRDAMEKMALNEGIYREQPTHNMVSRSFFFSGDTPVWAILPPQELHVRGDF